MTHVTEDEVWQKQEPKTLPWKDPKVISNHRRRKLSNNLVKIALVAVVLLALYPLMDMLYLFALRGLEAISVSRLILSTTPTGSGEPGGLANAVQGTLVLIGMSSAISIPFGVFGGVYMAEFSKNTGRFADAIRFVSDVIAGLPSIVLGYFGFLLFVLYFGWGFSAIAAGITLSVIMFPYILRTTELSIRKVPSSIREGALALGSTRTQMINRLTLRFALPGILTGILLSISIALGETAPLLYTAGISNQFPCATCLHTPVPYLTGIIWNFYTQPGPGYQDLAYLATFLLISIVVVINIVARFTIRRYSRI